MHRRHVSSPHKPARERRLPNTPSIVTSHKKDDSTGINLASPKTQTSVRNGRNPCANPSADSSCGTQTRTRPQQAASSKQRGGQSSERKGKKSKQRAASSRQQTTGNKSQEAIICKKPARTRRKSSNPKPIIPNAREADDDVPLEQQGAGSEHTLKASPGSPIELVESMQRQPKPKPLAGAVEIEMWRSAVDLRGGDHASDTGTSRALREHDIGYLEALLREGAFSEPRHVFGVFKPKADDETVAVYHDRVVRELAARMHFLEHTREKESAISRHEWETAHAVPLELSEGFLTPNSVEWDYSSD